MNFSDGFIPGVKAFTAAVLGGIGSLPGAVLGGLLIGLIEVFWSAYFSTDYKDVAAFSILAITLIFMPSGTARPARSREGLSLCDGRATSRRSPPTRRDAGCRCRGGACTRCRLRRRSSPLGLCHPDRWRSRDRAGHRERRSSLLPRWSLARSASPRIAGLRAAPAPARIAWIARRRRDARGRLSRPAAGGCANARCASAAAGSPQAYRSALVSASRRCSPFRSSCSALLGPQRLAQVDQQLRHPDPHLRDARLGPEHRGRPRRPARPRLCRLLRGRRLFLRAAVDHLRPVVLDLPAARRHPRRLLGHHPRLPGAAAARRLSRHRDAGLRRDHPHRADQLDGPDQRLCRHLVDPARTFFGVPFTDGDDGFAHAVRPRILARSTARSSCST